MIEIGKGEARARAWDAVTSHEAAATVSVSRDKRRVLLLFKQAAGRPLCDAELHDMARERGWGNASSSSLRSRRSQLADDGYIELAFIAPAEGYGARRRQHWTLTQAGRELAIELGGRVAHRI